MKYISVFVMVITLLFSLVYAESAYSFEVQESNEMVIWGEMGKKESGYPEQWKDFYSYNMIENKKNGEKLFTFPDGKEGFLVEDLEETKRILLMVWNTEKQRQDEFEYNLVEYKDEKFIDLGVYVNTPVKAFLGYMDQCLYYMVRNECEWRYEYTLVKQISGESVSVLSFENTEWHRPVIHPNGDIVYTAEDESSNQKEVMLFSADTMQNEKIANGEFGFWLSTDQIGYVYRRQLYIYDRPTRESRPFLNEKGEQIDVSISIYNADKIHYVKEANCIVYGTYYDEKVLLIFSMDTRHKQWTIQSLQSGKVKNIGRIGESYENLIVQ